MRSFFAKQGRASRCVAALALALTSVGGVVALEGTGVAAGSGGSLTLAAESGAYETTLQQVANSFMKANPGVSITVDGYPTPTYSQTIVTQFQANHAPDVFQSFGGYGDIASVKTLALAGDLAPLTSEPWAKSLPTGASGPYATLAIGKTLYAMPLGFSSDNVTYNVGLFKKLHLTVPTTFTQLLNLCHTIKADGKIAFALGGAAWPHIGITNQIMASDFVYSEDPSWNAKRDAGKVHFVGSPWASELEHFLLMRQNGCFEKGVAGVSFNDIFTQMAAQQTLMFPAPSGVAVQIDGLNKAVKLGVFVFPGDTTSETRATIAWQDSLVANSHSTNKALALKFIDFAATQSQTQLLANANGDVSPYDAAHGILPAGYGLLKPFIAKGLYEPLAQTGWTSAGVYEPFATDLEGLLTGQKNVTAILKDADAAWGK